MGMKLKQLPLQMDTGYHGAVRASALEDLSRGDIVSVVGRRGAYLQVALADSTKAKHSMLFIADHASAAGDIVRCMSFRVSDQELPPSTKIGSPVYLGKNGKFTTRTTAKKPRIIGTVIDDDGELRALIAPVYGE